MSDYQAEIPDQEAEAYASVWASTSLLDLAVGVARVVSWNWICATMYGLVGTI